MSSSYSSPPLDTTASPVRALMVAGPGGYDSDELTSPRAGVEVVATGRAAGKKTALLRHAAQETLGEIHGLQGGVDTLQSAIQEHASTLALYKQQLRAKEDENRSLTQEIKALLAERRGLVDAAEAAEERVRVLTTERQRAAADATRAEESSSLQDMRLRDVQARVEGLERDLADADQRARNAESECADFRRKVLGAEAVAETAGAKATAQAHQRAILEQELQVMEERNAGLERKVAELSRVDADVRARHTRMSADAADMRQKLARCEATIAELREGQHEIARLRAAVGEAHRQAHTAAASRATAEQELAKAEEALAAALREGTQHEQIRLDNDALRQSNALVQQKLVAATARVADLEKEVDTGRRTYEALEVTVVEGRSVISRLEDDIRAHEHRARLAEQEAALRSREADEVATLRAEVVRYQRECDELASGVERLHARGEADRLRCEELEALNASLKSEMGGRAAAASTAVAAAAATAADEHGVLTRQLTNVASTLNLFWTELAPHAFTSVAPGAPPGDGQLSALAHRTAAVLKAAGVAAERVRAVVLKYKGVLGDRARATAEAAMAADPDDDGTDDVDVSIQVVVMILDKLLADVGSARRVIEEQNRLLSASDRRSGGTTATTGRRSFSPEYPSTPAKSKSPRHVSPRRAEQQQQHRHHRHAAQTRHVSPR